MYYGDLHLSKLFYADTNVQTQYQNVFFKVWDEKSNKI